MLYTKTCRQCKKDFETKYSQDLYCSGDCYDAFKRDDYHKRWCNGKGNATVNAKQRLKMHKAGWSGRACN